MNWVKEIKNHTFKKYSQCGEEGYLNFIFDNIDVKNNFCVEFGAGDGEHLSNTKYFRELGWRSLLIDSQESEDEKIYQSKITKDNIVGIFEKFGVPNNFDLLSIDIDGNDYWVLEEILSKYNPRVIIAEFNASITESLAIEYNENHEWKGNNYFGFSLEAGKVLAKKYGYEVIFQNDDLNMYLVKKELLGDLEIDEVTCQHVVSFPIDVFSKWVEIK